MGGPPHLGGVALAGGLAQRRQEPGSRVQKRRDDLVHGFGIAELFPELVEDASVQ
jgi:hypothetical protein